NRLLLPVFIELLIGDMARELLVVVPCIRMLPVNPMRIIEAKFHIVLPAGVGNFADYIAAGSRQLRQGIFANLGVPKSYPVVVFGGNNDIFQAGFFCVMIPIIRSSLLTT